MKSKELKKLKNSDTIAVSAVIGVILMVAITVAIAAVVFLYSQGYIGSGNQGVPPTITWTTDQNANTLTITQGDHGFEYADTSNNANIFFKASNGTRYYIDITYQLAEEDESGLNTNTINAGDVIEGFYNDQTYDIIWKPLDIILGTVTFS